MTKIFLTFVCLLLLPFSSVLSQSLPTLEFEDIIVDEGDTATLILRLSSPVDHPVRVTLSTRKGNAVSGQDFESKSQRLTFAPGEISLPVSFQTLNDAIDEYDQFFWVYFRNPAGLDIDNERARITIIDNDEEPTIKFDYYEYSVIEGTSEDLTTVNIRVRLSHRSEKNIRFTVHTAANTATVFEFSSVAERVLFESRSVVFDYPVNVIADSDLEGRQQFYLYMRNPSNSILLLDDPTSDRIRTKIKIIDDDQLFPQPDIFSENSFTWIGTFGRRFTETELNTIANNTEVVVLAKFHALFDINVHHEEATLLRQRNPSLKIYPYFNAKHWFLESLWGTEPEEQCLIRDANDSLVIKATDRSDANYLDLRDASCREWMVYTITNWIGTNLYDGIAFDSAGPIGDFGEGTFWQDLLGGQPQVDAWNEGLATLLTETTDLLNAQGLSVIFNGIGESTFRDTDRDTFQLDYTDGALNESFAVAPSGSIRSSLLSDIELMQTSANKTLLMKTNVYNNGDEQRTIRLGRFAYGSFLMGWNPGYSYFKYGVDDFYTSAELEDFPAVRQYDLGAPVGAYQAMDNTLSREFSNFSVFVNTSDTVQTVNHNGSSFDLPPIDAVFVPKF